MKFSKITLISSTIVVLSLILIGFNVFPTLSAFTFLIASIVLIINVVKAVVLKEQKTTKKIGNGILSLLGISIALFIALAIVVPKTEIPSQDTASETVLEIESKTEPAIISETESSKIESMIDSSVAEVSKLESSKTESKITPSRTESKNKSKVTSSRAESKNESKVTSSKTESKNESKVTSSKTELKNESKVTSSNVESKITSSASESKTESKVESSKSASENDVPTQYQEVLDEAKSFIEFGEYSYSGLIEILEFVGYSNDEAEFAALNCNADWNNEAVQCAESYLDFKNMTKDELYGQLEYEGFTKEQISYALSKVESKLAVESEIESVVSTPKLLQFTFICNTKSMCYHTYECQAAKKILDENLQIYTIDAYTQLEAQSQIESMGYTLCGICGR